MSMAPSLSTFSDTDDLELDVQDYLKWRANNSHIGVRYVNQDHPQIFVPSESGQKVRIEKRALQNLSHIE